jgi:hypothetical protein
MKIDGTSSGVTGVSNVSATSAVGTSQARRNSSAPPAGGGSTQISKFGDMLSKLQELSVKDPAKFKQVAAEIATKLKDASATDPRLKALADKFSKAAESGDLSAFKPPAPAAAAAGDATAPGATPAAGATGATGAHHHHHHHGGGSSSGGGGTAQSSALKDLFASLSSGVDQALASPSVATPATTTTSP